MRCVVLRMSAYQAMRALFETTQLKGIAVEHQRNASTVLQARRRLSGLFNHYF